MNALLRLREATRRCPKHMIYGPCGGVATDGGCEVPGVRCSFGDDAALLDALAFAPAAVEAPESARESGDALPAAPRGPASSAFAARVGMAVDGGTGAHAIVTADLPVRTVDPGVLAETGARLAGLTAIIAGEPPGLRDALSPTHRALALVTAGMTVIAGVTCRDRNRVAIEGELAAIADIGVAGILALTGDHPASAGLAHAQPVFDLDSTRVTALARRAGLFVAVAEQPTAPPVGYRPARLALKARAGAELGILNLCGDIGEVARFSAAVAATSDPLPLTVSVPVLTSRAAARRLAALPGVSLPSGLVEALADADGAEAAELGIRAAVDGAARALAVPGVVGVHLSAVADATDPVGLAAVDAVARTNALLRERLGEAAAEPAA